MGDLWKFLLGGGGMLFLTTVGAGVKYLLEGAKSREHEAEQQARDWLKENIRRAKWEALQHDYWRDRANRAEGVITRKFGEEHLPSKRPYPKEPKDDTGSELKVKDRD